MHKKNEYIWYIQFEYNSFTYFFVEIHIDITV